MGDTERERAWSPWRYQRTHHPDVIIYEAELAGNMLGCVDIAGRRIWLDNRLTQAEKRSTLAHELGHLERGSLCDSTGDAIEERSVEEWAARQLIDARALARALRWSCRIDDIAEELWVDEHLVRARLRGLTDDEQDLMMRALEHARTVVA